MNQQELENLYCVSCEHAAECQLNVKDCEIAHAQEISHHLKVRNNKEQSQEWKKDIEDILGIILDNQKTLLSHIKQIRITLHESAAKSS